MAQRRFFDSVEAMLRFARSPALQAPPLHCARCQSCDDWVLHDYVYKQLTIFERTCVGKRLLCSNRGQRGGCGATLRLSLSSRVAQLQYGCAALSAFVMALIAGLSIRAAYRGATGTHEPRHGYRWLQRFSHTLSKYRQCLGQRTHTSCADRAAQRVHRLRLLLPTFQALANKVGEPLISAFQCRWQSHFL
jgi:hypothetical protein